MIRKLYDVLFKRQRIRPLPRHLVRAFNTLDLDYDTLLILMTARAKDPAQVKRLMLKYDAKSASELIDRLPPRRKISPAARLLSWLARLEGSYATPPENYAMRHRTRRRERQYTMRVKSFWS